MYKRTLSLLTASYLLLVSGPVSAIIVDGNISDWLSTPTGTNADWGNTLRSSIQYIEGDQSSTPYYLNPGYGGQEYDVEAIYGELIGSTLNIAVVTGCQPGFCSGSTWMGGDIALNFDFASDSTSFEYGIVVQNHDALNAGEVYAVDAWEYGIWTAPNVHDESSSTSFKSSHPVSVKSGTLKDNVSIAYEQIGAIGGLGGAHYLIETSIDLSLLGLGLAANDPFSIHWAPTCNNDYLELQMPASKVPEPGALILMATGLIGLVGSRILKRKA